jgi:hypothetical protein
MVDVLTRRSFTGVVYLVAFGNLAVVCSPDEAMEILQFIAPSF